MGLERLPALVKGDGVLEVDLALLELGYDRFEFLERGLEAHGANRCARRGCARMGDFWVWALAGTSRLHHGAHMGGRGPRKGCKVIAAFQHRNNAPAAGLAGDFADR